MLLAITRDLRLGERITTGLDPDRHCACRWRLCVSDSVGVGLAQPRENGPRQVGTERRLGDWPSGLINDLQAQGVPGLQNNVQWCGVGLQVEVQDLARSEERRVGKECRSRWSP